MKMELLAGLTPEDQEKRKAMLRSCHEALDVYKEVLQARLEKVYEEVTGKKLFDNPNWAYLQAESTGLARAYREMIDLLTLDREE